MQQLHDAFGLRLLEREPMSRHTNFRVGGPAAAYLEARTPEDVIRAVTIARECAMPWFILGGGSNTLVADAGFDGLVIQLANREVRVEGTRVIAGAGAITAAVARTAGDVGLTGFEWAISLPGTIGGAVRGNAGCFGGETKDVVERVQFFSPSRGEGERPVPARASGEGVGELTNAQCGFAYRHSIFKQHPEWIILEVTLAFKTADPAACHAAMDQFLERRKQSQPHDKPSAGCLFKNVEIHTLSADAMDRLERFSSGAWRGVVHDGQLPVGWLIDRLGLKGRRIGNAQISEKHGNFMLNLGGATAADVLALGEEVRAHARDALGIEIEYEVQRIGH